MRFTLLALGFFLMACNEEPPIEPYTGPIDPYVGTVKMWVEDNHFNLPKEEAVKGCEFWAPKGVSCELTDNQESANVKVKLDPDMPTNGTFLAWAYSSGLIILYPHGPTWFTEDGEIDGFAFRVIMGHEIGHTIGIRGHIPVSCENDDPICGKALMNATFRRKVDFITDLDALAFDNRDPVNVLTSKQKPLLQEPEETVPDCTYQTGTL